MLLDVYDRERFWRGAALCSDVLWALRFAASHNNKAWRSELQIFVQMAAPAWSLRLWSRVSPATLESDLYARAPPPQHPHSLTCILFGEAHTFSSAAPFYSLAGR